MQGRSRVHDTGYAEEHESPASPEVRRVRPFATEADNVQEMLSKRGVPCLY